MFQKPQQLGWARIACLSRHVRSEPGTISAASAVASCSWNSQRRRLFVEFVTAKRFVCKNGNSLVEPPPRVFYTVSVSGCLFVGEQFFFTGTRSCRPHRSHFSQADVYHVIVYWRENPTVLRQCDITLFRTSLRRHFMFEAPWCGLKPWAAPSPPPGKNLRSALRIAWFWVKRCKSRPAERLRVVLLLVYCSHAYGIRAHAYEQ